MEIPEPFGFPLYYDKPGNKAGGGEIKGKNGDK